MRKKIIAANWKMNHTLSEATAFAGEFEKGVGNALSPGTEVLIAPAFPFLGELVRRLGSIAGVGIAAQNVHEEEQGAFTGEVSAAMLRSVGCTHVIIGHSERRALYGEGNSLLLRKVHQALTHQLIPVFCIGETLAEREAGKVAEVVSEQLKQGLFALLPHEFEQVVIAYEPVWAIGTGVVATPAQAQEVHALVRKLVEDRYGAALAAETSILYGGSVKPDNAASLFTQPDIDGALVGGASLNASHFLQIVLAMR